MDAGRAGFSRNRQASATPRHWSDARQYVRVLRRGNYYFKGNSGGRADKKVWAQRPHRAWIPPIFEPSEHVFDFVALLVDEGVIGYGDLPIEFRRDVDGDAAFARTARNQSAS